MIHIVNKRTHIPTDRDKPIHRGFPLGNPYDWRGSKLAQFQCSCREEAIANYRAYFDEKVQEGGPIFLTPLREIYKLAKSGDVYLVCYCNSREECHGQVIAEFIERKLNEASSSNQ